MKAQVSKPAQFYFNLNKESKIRDDIHININTCKQIYLKITNLTGWVSLVYGLNCDISQPLNHFDSFTHFPFLL